MWAGSYEQLGDIPSERSRSKSKAILVSVAVILTTLAAVGIFLAVFLVEKSRHGDDNPANRLPFTFEDYLGGTFSPRSLSITWLPDGNNLLFQNGTDCLYMLNSTFDVSLFLNFSTILLNDKPIKVNGYWLSYDAKKVLIATEQVKLWRHSFFAAYYVYDIDSKTLLRVGPADRLISNCVWSPANYMVAYVDENDVYIQDMSANGIAPIRVTQDGSTEILNGVQGWVYEEEVFSDTIALWWSPSGDALAFMKTNESLVPIFEFPWYGNALNGNPYQEMRRIRYPKAGAPNPIVEVYVFNTTSQDQPVAMNMPQEPDYITYVGWISNAELVIRTLNRAQQRELMHFHDPTTGVELRSFETQATTTGWIDFKPGPLYIDDTSFLILRNNSGYYHIARVNALDGSIFYVTSGDYDVTDILAIDKDSSTVYYLSAEISPTERHLYSINYINGTDKRAFTQSPGYYTADFSPSGKKWILTNTGPNPTQQILISGDGSSAPLVLEENNELKELMKRYNLPTKEFIQIPVNGETLNAFMLKPADFDERKKYPLIMRVYGGPGSQTVMKQFAMNWDAFLCANLSAIVVSVDNRGTGARGLAFLQQTYKRLGILESDDQIAAAQWLASNYDFIDSARIGLWGWSYGGFMTLTVLSRSSLLKTAIAVAPVTDWRLYDSAYTEKFMSTPQLNPEGYTLTSNILRAANITSDFLLIHGTADDNVHFQNSAEMVMALVRHNIPFAAMYYPNSDHAINYGGATRHIYRLMWNHWKDKL